jgi:hypothetical protein
VGVDLNIRAWDRLDASLVFVSHAAVCCVDAGGSNLSVDRPPRALRQHRAPARRAVCSSKRPTGVQATRVRISPVT